ncbi:MAG: roadblock/LC7 domain-containing protein [Xenococcaceae cyanobacterium]
MEFDIVFLHGTGVREPACSKTFNTIVRNLKARDENLRFHKCYWGGSLGTTLNAAGQSIPVEDANKALDVNLSDEEYLLGLWELLFLTTLLFGVILISSEGFPLMAALDSNLDEEQTAAISSQMLFWGEKLVKEVDRGEYRCRTPLIIKLYSLTRVVRAKLACNAYWI